MDGGWKMEGFKELFMMAYPSVRLPVLDTRDSTISIPAFQHLEVPDRTEVHFS
jgi:hypothetical protein